MVGYTSDDQEGTERKSRHLFAACGQCRRADYQHLRNGLSWDDDVDWTCVYIRPAKVVVYWPVNAYAKTSARMADPSLNRKLDDAYFNVYMRCIGWWPPLGGPLIAGPGALEKEPLVPIAAFLEMPDLKIVDDHAVVRGRRCCHIMRETTSHADEVWLDVERSYTLIERRLKFVEPPLEVRFANQEFVEVLNGAWLPRRVRQQVWRRNNGAGERKILSDATFTVSEIKANSGKIDELFVFEPPPGAIVADWDARTLSFMPGSAECQLNRLAHTARRRLVVSRSGRSTGVAAWAVVGIATICGLACVGIAASRLPLQLRAFAQWSHRLRTGKS